MHHDRRCLPIRIVCSLLFTLTFAAVAQRPEPKQQTHTNDDAANSTTLPHLTSTNGFTELIVGSKPFIMLGGEFHNSSASSVDYMRPIWDKVATLHANTVISTVSWELTEPQEDRFDFALVDAQIAEARRHHLHLVLIWFASWKNGNSFYVPSWVKADHQRFPLQQIKEDTGIVRFIRGQRELPLSPFSEALLGADSNAFRRLMHHVRQVDPQHTVIMMQVENEVGLRGDSRDRSPLAEAAWSRPVPAELLHYLSSKQTVLLPETDQLWSAHGRRTSGTWGEVFGSDPWGEQVFMAWQYAHFINEVTRAGKAELRLPMYVNAWLSSSAKGDAPGNWPSGGPVAGMLDIWRAGAPDIDFFAPDIYVDEYKEVCAQYARAGNPLFIPEARDQAGNLFWTVGHHAALGWSVFGIDDLSPDGQIAKAYATLNQLLPALSTWQKQKKVDAVLLTDGKGELSLGGYTITFSPSQPVPRADSGLALQAGGVSEGSRTLPGDTRPFGIVINTAPDEFTLVGSNLHPEFHLASEGNYQVMVESVDEGSFDHGRWVPLRRLNGDEGGYLGMTPMRWVKGPATLPILRYRLYRVGE